MDPGSSIEIIEECKVTPPQNWVETTKLPLTFFDMPWIMAQPVESILFYEFPHTPLYFTQTILPQLKHSLSITLRHYFPLVGSLVCPPLPTEPYILYRDGDFVPLTIAQSDMDFHGLVQDNPKHAIEFRPLVPNLTNRAGLFSSDKDQAPVKAVHPLVALQVTIFPNSGMSICFKYHHVVADGRTMNNFVKSWASLMKSKNDSSVIAQPFHDRTSVLDGSKWLLSLMCKQYHQLGVSWDNIFTSNNVTTAGAEFQDRLHATFLLGSHEIALIRNWIVSRFQDPDQDQDYESGSLPYVSTFVVTCAFVWVCLLGTQHPEVPANDSVSNFGLVADCTERRELKVPKTYIGNCLTLSGQSIAKKALLGANGMAVAAKAIMQMIKEQETGVLDKAQRWLPRALELSTSSEFLFGVSGSPKMGVYETDFGWGKPIKSESVHIDKETWSVFLAESRDLEKGGVEIGVSLNKIDMEAFTCIFQQCLNKCRP